MRKKPFTLLELSAAMAVLVIFMLFIMRFFTTSQDVMNRSSGKTDQYERARIVMDLLANDLQNLYYTEGVDETVYYQNDTGSGDGKNTQNLSFYALRPQRPGADTKTDMTWVTYHFDSTDYTLKLGIAGDDSMGSWGDHLSGSSLAVLADGVYRFRVIPFAASGGTEITSPSSLSSGDAGSRRIPDFVRIELQLMDGETAAAIKQIKKVSAGGALPDAMNPAKDAFTGKDKIRSFFRIVEIDRGQYGH